MENIRKAPLVYDSKLSSDIFMEDCARLIRCEVLGVCYVGYYTYMNSGIIRSHVEIGRYCSIGRNVSIGLGSHNIDMASTSPFFDFEGAKSSLKLASECPKRRVKIGNDVWIGDNVLINSGVTIGDGCVIGAGTIVTKDIEPYSIAVGVPGKVLRKRFDESTIERLVSMKWWNMDPEILKREQHMDIGVFMDRLSKVDMSLDGSTYEISYNRIPKS